MISLDVETTGVYSYLNSMIEIGAIDLKNPQNRFFTSIQAIKDREVSPRALEINGHSLEDLYDIRNPTLKEAIGFLEFWVSGVNELIIMGQNPRFDVDFLREGYKIIGKKAPWGIRTVDLHSTVLNHLNMKGMKIPLNKKRGSDVDSDWIMNYVGIPAEPKPHQALNGAIYEAEAYNRIIYGKNLLPEFKEFEVPDYLKV